MQDTLDRAKKIQLAIFDVDGVMTDGSLYLGDNGEEMKAYNSLDGHGLKMLQAGGVKIAVITGRTSPGVALRMNNLGIAELYQGAENKLAVFAALCEKLGITFEACAYMGDDVVDLPVLRRAGLAVCVPAAPALVQRHAHYVTRRGGGRGAVRELCELLLLAQGKLDAQLAQYLV